jgi:hypothetical protein
MTIEYEALREDLRAWMTGAECPRLRTFDLRIDSETDSLPLGNER